jgi:hypothetical protein
MPERRLASAGQRPLNPESIPFQEPCRRQAPSFPPRPGTREALDARLGSAGRLRPQAMEPTPSAARAPTRLAL